MQKFVPKNILTHWKTPESINLKWITLAKFLILGLILTHQIIVPVANWSQIN